jgi:hypothetical protein
LSMQEQSGRLPTRLFFTPFTGKGANPLYLWVLI